MESAKREEGLVCLRTEASAASRITATPHVLFPAPAPPLLEAAEVSPRTPRFDNYTNSGAAFSGSQRKGGYCAPSSSTPPQCTRPYAGPRSYYAVPSHPPAQQFNTTQLPDNNVPFPMLPQAPQNSPWRSPVQFQTPFSGYQGTYSSCPGPWNASTGSPNRGFYPNSSRGGFTSPRFGRGSHMSNPGNRGTGQYSSSPNTRGRGGRGQSFNKHSGQVEPEHYYSKAMVEDPWLELKPVVGDILKTRNTSTSWLPESLTGSKGKSNQSGLTLDSELSLTEYLGISLKETIDET